MESLSVGSDSTDQDVFDIDKVEANDLPDLSLDIETQELDKTDYELDITNSEDTDTVSTELSLDDSLTLEIDKLDVDDDLTLNIDSADNNIDSDLDFDSSDLASSGGELEFDLDNFDEIDEAETKLDLAVAYIDMGDPDGAKSILDEVITDGNDEQKSRAQDLLASLA
jgi:pilus assembly protein FimV